MGALSLHSACKVAYFRGKLIRELCISASAPGAMMSVGLSENDILDYLKRIGSAIPVDEVHISCINSPLNCTVSATEDVIDRFQIRLEKDGIFAQKLNTGVSYHSPIMQKISDRYRELMGSLQVTDESSFTKLMVSSVTGNMVPLGVLSEAQYWVDNLISPVKFSDAVLTLVQQKIESSLVSGSAKPVTDLIEIGPHSTLRRPLQDILGHSALQTIRYCSVLNRSKSSLTSVLEIVGHLFSHGHPVSISKANGQLNDQQPVPFLVDCPKYPFDHSRQYWTESRLSRNFRLRGGSAESLLGRRVYDWNPLEPRWRTVLSPEFTPWLEDHVVRICIFYDFEIC